ncbi:MAG TPA: molybdate ABC transporter permease subunit [Longimicrobiales bacterium]|nr:molybdate ABC transporter permease subunit [Longimicrobiales bacterium]
MSHLALSRIRPPWALALALALSARGEGALLGQEGIPAPGGREPILVLAAASLTDVLPAVAQAWAAHGGGPVRFSFDATSRLAPQAVEGAPADLFFSADQAWMDWLGERGGVVPASIRDFLGNSLVVVVPAGRAAPSGPEGLLALDRIALAGENVPAGRYAQEALEALGLWTRLSGRVVRGGSVRGALEWVSRGEVDAGVVYRTDALAQPAVTVAFGLPADAHREVRYPAAVLSGSRHPRSAEAFLDFAAGPVGREIFRAAGFEVTGATPVATGPAVPVAALPDPTSAVRISLVVALLATLAGLAPAVGLGWVLARTEFRGKALVSTLVFAPLVLPPVVTGFLLLSLVGSQGPLGRALGSVGISIPFTLVGAAVAAFVVGLPLYVLSVRGAFEAVDPHYEELSWTLGVRPRETFRRISLPLALPGIAAGAVLAFARALGEFGATVVLAGNVEGSTRTIALAVYTLLESPSGRRTTWVLVGASVALSLVALLGFEALSRRQRRRLEVHGGE